MPQNASFISSEMYAAIAGVLVTFVLTILYQYFIDRRNKTQLTYSKKIESPLSIPKNELKEKLKIYYDFDEIKDIFYARLTIKNTGQKTIKKQILRCEFDKDSRLIDREFPLIITSPKKEIIIEKVLSESQRDFQSNVYRYQIEALAPGQGVQIDFLFDGNKKDFDVSFRPNQIDEVKILEGTLSSDPNLEFYIVQFGQQFTAVMVLLLIANILGIALGALAALGALLIFYYALVSFRKLVPLFLEAISKNEKPDYQIEVGNGARSHIVIGDGVITMKPEEFEGEEEASKSQSATVIGNGVINISSDKKTTPKKPIASNRNKRAVQKKTRNKN